MGKGNVCRVAAALFAGAVLAACALTDRPRGEAASPVVEPQPAPAARPEAPAPPTTLPAPAPAPIELAPPPPKYLAPGVHEHQVQIDAQARRWTTVVPPSTEGGAAAALVVVLHGVGGRGADMRSTGFEALASAPRTVVAYPDAFGGAWNDGRPGVDPPVPGVMVDDTRFLRLLIEETVARTGADPRRVAVVGFSNGAVMAGRVACDLADTVSAVALVAGSGGQGFEQSCKPVRPVAVMMVAGSNDRTVPYGGGRVPDWGARKRGFVAPVEDFFAFWRRQSGCATTQVSAGPPQVSLARGADCRTDTTVLRYRVNGGGHEWFKAPALDTTTVVWDFLSRRFSAAA
jgi:polyhydroxybutyrate depolymerase